MYCSQKQDIVNVWKQDPWMSRNRNCECVWSVKGKGDCLYSNIQNSHWNLHQLSPGIGTYSFTVSSPGVECSTFSAAEAIHTVLIFHSTWYPVLSGGQRRCGFKASPGLLHITSNAAIESQTPWSQVQPLKCLTVRSTSCECVKQDPQIFLKMIYECLEARSMHVWQGLILALILQRVLYL